MLENFDLNLWLPVLVSTLALLFSVASFWWMHWRRGRLVVSPPRSFMSVETDDKIIVELPLGFYNDGPAATVIDNLLLRADQEKVRMLFRFEYTRDDLGAESHNWATQVALAGREAVMKVFSFQARKGETNLSVGVWSCSLLAKLNHAAGYQEIARFKLNVSRLGGSFSAMDNTAAEYQNMVKRYILTKK